MVDEGSQGPEQPVEQTAEQPAVPEAAAAVEAVTSEFVAGAQQPSTSANGFEAETEAGYDPHPEYAVGAAFVGGFLFGRLVRRLGR